MRIAVRLRPPLIRVCAFLAVAGALPTVAQEQTAADPTELITAREIEATILAVQNSTTLSEDQKTQIVSLYNDAITHVRARDEWSAKTAAFQQDRESAPADLERFQEDLQERPDEIDLAADFVPDASEQEAEEALAGASATDLEVQLVEADRKLAELRDQVADLEKEPARRAERRRLIPELQAAARQRLTETQAQLDALNGGSDPTELMQARRTVFRAQIQALNQELQAYEEELKSYEARRRVLTARLDLRTREKGYAERVANAWRELVAERRSEEAQQAAEEAIQALFEASDAPPQIRQLVESLAQENVQLAETRTGDDGILRKIEQTEREIPRVTGRLTTLNDDFASVRNRVSAVGNTEAIGVLLRTKRANLPDSAELRRNIRLRSNTVGKLQLDRLGYEERRRALADIEEVIDTQLNESAPGVTENAREQLASLLRDTYRTQRDTLDALITDLEKYDAQLLKLDGEERELLEATREFETFIDEHILWIRSGSTFGSQHARDAVAALVWPVLPDNLIQPPGALLEDYLIAPVPLTLAYALPIALLFFGRAIRKRVLEHGETAAKRRCTDIRPTFRAAVLVLLRSIGPPLLLGLIGWRLSVSLYTGDYARATGQGCIAAAVALWTLYLPRLVLRPGGLAEKHFGWPKEPMRRMSRHLIWFTPTAVILVFLISLYEADGDLDRQESAGRLLFVVLLVCIAWLSYSLLKPRGGALLDAFDMWRGRGRLGMRRFWFAIGMITPAMLMGAAGAGYYYSALRLASRLYITTFVAFLLLLAAAIALRWSLVARRRIAIEQAKRRLEALKAEAKEGEKPPEEPELDLAKVDSQTGRLVRSTFLIGLLVSIWFLWAEFLPALSVLNEAEVWSTSVQTTIEEVGDDGAPTTRVITEQIPITWRDVVVAMLIGIATFIAVQNIPGLLEFAVLQRLSLVAGERYAIKTIFGYALVLVGFLSAVSTIGLGWSQVQWLVAAVGLGLGFGLQEIFANFIAGLIILFEQPIRVGDTVTVGDTSGRVSKIRIRATWITAFNRQELVVPNKEFVTGRLINWTLSDQILRIEIPVGIAYGSDTKKARALLYEVARKSDMVLKDPAPEVYFLGFGDNSLNFELRVYSPDIESFLRIRDEMHEAVDEAFRKANIEIAFPQRDIHIRHIKDVLPIKQSDAEPDLTD